jgi:hypothetical protein
VTIASILVEMWVCFDVIDTIKVKVSRRAEMPEAPCKPQTSDP